MKPILHAAAAILFLTLSPAAFAQETPQQQLAREVMAATGAEEMLHSMLADFAPLISSQATAMSGFTGERARQFERIVAEEFRAAAPRMLDLAVESYAATFSEAELREILAFYQTPVGRAMVERQSQIESAMQSQAEQIGVDVVMRAAARIGATSKTD